MSSAQNQYLFPASLPALGYSTYYFEARGIFTKSSTYFAYKKGVNKLKLYPKIKLKNFSGFHL
jgi:hypothetical protein